MEEVTQSSHGISRRTLIKGAAWSAPVIAVAVAAPLAAASGTVVPNGVANYYWDAEAQGAFTSLVAAGGGLRATFSTQISYRANPWVNPPSGASLVVVVSFSSPVTLDPASSFGQWTPVPPGGSSATSFTFTRTPSSFGDALSFNVIGTAPGALTSTATMSLINGGSATATTEPSAQTATLIA
ncbi:hypothetical protein [Microbacterium sp. p3-SID336]|uniref:hypothetical protein n=1 Tax=Microbacterium sp. p3-SID336 TaxID=2916212 RepID=UPI0021A951F8|nr:hypothetical protein [Microbacterium sp. p3-SID336]MCT1478066.1 hypothetical protein [Microbacterium sp. p3-SID336]